MNYDKNETKTKKPIDGEIKKHILNENPNFVVYQQIENILYVPFPWIFPK